MHPVTIFLVLLASSLFQDLQYGDIDYMRGKRIFTYDPVTYAGLPAYIQELKQQGTRFIIILVSPSHLLPYSIMSSQVLNTVHMPVEVE